MVTALETAAAAQVQTLPTQHATADKHMSLQVTREVLDASLDTLLHQIQVEVCMEMAFSSHTAPVLEHNPLASTTTPADYADSRVLALPYIQPLAGRQPVMLKGLRWFLPFFTFFFCFFL